MSILIEKIETMKWKKDKAPKEAAGMSSLSKIWKIKKARLKIS